MFVDMKYASVPIEQYFIFRGDAYRAYDRVSLPALGGKQYWKVEITGKNMGLFNRIISANEPDVTYTVYSGSVIDQLVGDPIPVRNISAGSPNNSGVTIQRCTIVSIGEEVDLDIVRGINEPGNRGSGSTFQPVQDIRPYVPGVYLLEAENPSSNIADFLLYLKWFEYDGDALLY